MLALKRNPFYSSEVDETLAALDEELEELEQSETPGTSFQPLYHDVVRVANELGHPPTRAEYRREGQYRTQVLCRRFNPVSGTGEGAMWELEFDTIGETTGAKEIPSHELHADVNRVAGDDDWVSRSQYQKEGRVSVGTITNRFAGASRSWHGAMRGLGYNATDLA